MEKSEFTLIVVIWGIEIGVFEITESIPHAIPHAIHALLDTGRQGHGFDIWVQGVVVVTVWCSSRIRRVVTATLSYGALIRLGAQIEKSREW